MQAGLTGVDSAVLVEVLQQSEQKVGRLMDKAIDSQRWNEEAAWLLPEEWTGLMGAFLLSLECECELRARYEALNNETALD